MMREYEMSEEDLARLADASKPTRAMMIGSVMPRTPQQNANDAWASLGRKMGFHHFTAKPVEGKSDRFFTAEPRCKGEPDET